MDTNIMELREAVDALSAEVSELTELDEITPEQDQRLDDALDELDAARAQLDKAETRAARVAKALAERTGEAPGVPDPPQFMRRVDADVDARTAPIGEVRDAARKIIEEARFLSPGQQDVAERRLFGATASYSSDAVARRLVATERPEYRDAFFKGVTGQESMWTDAERRAVAEVRAMSLTDTSGGYGVPVLIDPTVLITDGQGLLGVLEYARIETITTDAWKGVSAAHTAWSFDAEAAEVSADDSTFAQPSVTAHSARGFIPYSIEIGMDYPGFASEMGRLLNDGYMDLLAENLMTGAGDGSNAPWGLFTTTTTTVDVTTDNTFGAEDLDAVWAAVPEKFRARSVWVMNVDVENDIRGFGSGTATSRFTVDQTREGISLLNGKPVVLSDHAPTWTGTDGASILVVGDLSNYVVAQRAGMTVEYIPHLFGTTNARPTGQRGWFAHARVGADLVVQNSVRKLKNQTT